jgi:hypothetical protein
VVFAPERQILRLPMHRVYDKNVIFDSFACHRRVASFCLVESYCLVVGFGLGLRRP